MYTLLLVEDETFTREGLQRHIDWNSIGIGEIHAFSNGLSALQATDTFFPHILLSDIKMPHMNGIELAREIRRRFPSCHIIFLSGHADKEYLLSAISLKADCFVEKPVNLPEISQAVKNAVEQLNLEQQYLKKHHDSSNPRTSTAIMPVIQKDILSTLLDSTRSWEAFRKKYTADYFSWSKTGSYYLICIKLYSRDITTSSSSFVDEAIAFFSGEGCILSEDYYLDYKIPYDLTLLFQEKAPAQLYDLMKKFQDYFFTSFSIETTIGLSTLCTDLECISAVYQILTLMTEYHYFYFGRRYIFYAAHQFKSKPTPKDFFYTPKFNLEGVERVFQALSSEKYTNIEEIRIQLYEFYTLMMERTINDQNIPWDQFKPMILNEYIDLIGYGMKAFQILGNNTFDIKIKNAVHYILWNYLNPDLSIQMISDHAGLSPNYLCNLFKKQTGSTVNDFLIKVRMDKARILLEKTDLKLYEIAEKVGLQDANYFSTSFKKEYGMSPSAYRNHREDIV